MWCLGKSGAQPALGGGGRLVGCVCLSLLMTLAVYEQGSSNKPGFFAARNRDPERE